MVQGLDQELQASGNATKQDDEFHRPEGRHEIAFRAYVLADLPGASEQGDAGTEEDGQQAGADEVIKTFAELPEPGEARLKQV
jgi:hypothetical protein